MTHQDRVALIEKGVNSAEGLWADLGSGYGAFTLALAELLRPPAELYSIDEDSTAVENQKKLFRTNYPGLKVYFLTQDFTRELQLPSLDGILMANALHYLKEKSTFIRRIHSYLKSQGCLILVEYNAIGKSPWVPYPISFEEWKSLSRDSGFKDTRLLGKRPSKYHREIYATVSLK